MRTDPPGMKRRFLPVAREGYPYIAAAWLVGMLLLVTGPLALAALVLLAGIFTLWFFRDPERSAPPGERLVISPADGAVICLDDFADDPDIGAGSVISIFMSVFNVHVNRVPATGVVARVQHHPGRFLSAFKKEAPEMNERTEVVITTPRGPVKSVQVAGLIARRIVCRLSPGDPVRAGERYGLIRFGSRLDVYLPAGCSLRVKEGARVKSGVTVLAEMGDAR